MNRKHISSIFVALLVAFAAYRAFFVAKSASVRNAEQKGQVIVVFGDGHAEKLGTEVAGRKVINLGRPGDTSVAAAARVAELEAAKPNYVLVALGSEDLEQRMTLDQTLGALETVITKAQNAGALVVYLPVEPPPGTGDNWLMAIRDLVRSKSAVYGQGSAADSLKTLF